ncbi:acetate/propionate family kinase [Caulobacter sp.]|uniref:acetate/propionate family kinase n=1 Tax=Caulobacter sp. TaxID=78 RepID=UPI0025B7F212|nr:acetate/propionate family kinase [Caulobacter sp.]MBQ1561933.1 acetate/propionate family kinase [Caulobacter sp.]
MTGSILSLNAGSSSLKFGLYRRRGRRLVETVRGAAENLSTQAHLVGRDSSGETLISAAWTPGPEAPDHAGALERVLAWVGRRPAKERPSVVARRIVHGGERSGPTVVTPGIETELEALAPRAPLHQPAGLELLRLARSRLPQATPVACFDTSFHATMPECARIFAIPREISAKGVRRYGFHGVSYAHLVRRLRQIDAALAPARIVAAHLGAGASLCAVAGGKGIDTTMGFRPLDGLVMATRCGSLDPGVILHLLSHGGLTPEGVEALLYRRSGLLGVSGDLRELVHSDAEAAALAVELFVYRAVQAIGSMAATLGGLDGLVFTGGVGEHNSEVRARICRRLAWLGVDLDPQLNAAEGERRIDSRASSVAIWVIPTNEEAEMARQAADLLWPPLSGEPQAPAAAERIDRLLDEALDETFPASDPPTLVQPHDPDGLEPPSRDQGPVDTG